MPEPVHRAMLQIDAYTMAVTRASHTKLNGSRSQEKQIKQLIAHYRKKVIEQLEELYYYE